MAFKVKIMNNIGGILVSLASFLASIYLILTVVLLFKRKTAGNLFMVYGGLTFIFVIVYGIYPKIPTSLQGLIIFIIFSLMILLFGLTFGISLRLFKRSNKVSRIGAVFGGCALIMILFKVGAYLNYLYIPVLLYMIQDKVNKKYMQ